MAKDKTYNYKDLIKVLLKNDAESFDDFVKEYGLNTVEKKDKRNLLMECIHENNNEYAKKLIDLGININYKDQEGMTSLMAAIISNNNEMIDYLLSLKELEINAQDSFGKNALAIALQNSPKDKELIIKLIKNGSDPYLKNNYGDSSYSRIKDFQTGKRTIGNTKLDYESVLEIIENLKIK